MNGQRPQLDGPSHDAVIDVMHHEDIGYGEALRRLVAYGDLVYRAARLHSGDVLLRPTDNIHQILRIDDSGRPVLVDIGQDLVWMRPTWSGVVCAFPGAEVAAGIDPLEPIAWCDRWAVADLVVDNQAEECNACLRAVKRWGGR